MKLSDELKAKSRRAVAHMGGTAQADDSKLGGVARPVTAVGAVAFMQPTIDALSERAKDAEARAISAEAANEELRRKVNAQPTEVDLELLDEKPGRKRKLTAEQFEELKENLRNNPLVQPVAVKRLASGRFEIVSGHNRVDAFRALGRSAIPVVVVDFEDEVVDRAAFYANLLQPSLPDFEKYLGFKREKDKTGASQKEMARLAGVPESTVSMLFSFESLPERARELVEDRPFGIGMNCASELGRLTRDGAGDRVVEAIELLLAGKLTQKEAVVFASKKPLAPIARATPPTPVKIKAGRLEYCQYVARGSSLRIEFKAEEERAEAEKRISEVLKELAQASKASS